MKFIRCSVFCLCIFFFLKVNAQAQVFRTLFFENPGLQIGMYQGQTDLRDSGYNYFFRLYNRHELNPDLFGQLSISSGNISGLLYKSRLTPIEYRLGISMSKFGISNPQVFGRNSLFYTYGGLGLLYSRPLMIAAPDDPLTVEMGNQLPTSPFWKFDGGISPFIPVGVGMELRLDERSRFNISAGYNQSLPMLKFNSRDVPNGYWAFSIGIDFGRSPRPEPVFPLPAPVMAVPSAKPVVHNLAEVPLKVEDIRLSKINYRPINFDVLSSSLVKEEEQWIDDIADILSVHPDVNLHIIGHADATGTELVNEMISESRARSVWLELLEQGLDINRMKFKWYAAEKPVGDNSTKQGRFKNRRVELHTSRIGLPKLKFPGEEQIFIASIVSGYEYEKPIFSGYDIHFSGKLLGLDQYGKMLIKLVSYLMMSEPEMEMIVLNQVTAEAGEGLRISLAKARADFIKGELILNGISPQRIHSAAPGTTLYEQYKRHFSNKLQQNILIPVKREKGINK